MLYTEGDLRAGIMAALLQVAEFDDDEQDTANGIIDGAVAISRVAQENRIPLDNDHSERDVDSVMRLRVEIQRERKELEQRDKVLKKLLPPLDERIKLFAQEATILPPYKVEGGGTIVLGSRVWARPNVDRDASDEDKAIARASAITRMSADEELASFVRPDFNIMSLSSYFKEEINEGRIKLDGEGKAVLLDGALLVIDETTVSVRGI